MGFIETIVASFITSIVTFVCFNYIYKPYEKYKDLKSYTSYVLILYKNLISNPYVYDDVRTLKVPENYQLSSVELRKLAAEWAAFHEWRRFIPSKKKINSIVSNLIGLSNSLTIDKQSLEDRNPYKNNKIWLEEIHTILKLKCRS